MSRRAAAPLKAIPASPSACMNNLPCAGFHMPAADLKNSRKSGFAVKLGAVCLFAIGIFSGGTSNAQVAPATAVGTTSAPQTATIYISTAGTPGTISVLTQGATGLDFNLASGGFAGGGTCAAQSYNQGDTCTVQYTFTATHPWLRQGGITLTDSTGVLLGNSFINGMGTGPMVTFPSNATVNTLGNGASLPSGGFSSPKDVAVDGSGNVYVADTVHNAVEEILAVGGVVSSSSTVITLSIGASNSFGGFSYPTGVAVDGSGNVYVADHGNGAVEEIMAVGGVIPASPTINTLGSGFSSPQGVAVDGSGNVYVADTGNNAVEEMLAVGGVIPASPTITTLGSGFGNPSGVAVDGGGNVYIADQNNDVGTVEEIVAGTGGATSGTVSSGSTVLTLSGNFNGPSGVAVDGSGNVYGADSYDSLVKEIDLSDAPSLSFASPTLVGTTDTDGPQTVIVANSGNAVLTFPVPGSGNNPSISANFILDRSFNTCPVTASGPGTPGSLAQGTSCTLAIDFVPVAAGSISGSLVFTDNSPFATQTIALGGTATQQTPTFGAMSFSPAATETYGTSQIVTISDTLVYTGSGAVPTGAVTFVLNGVSYTAGCTGSSSPLTCTYAVPAATIAALPATGYTVTAAYAADTIYTAATGISGTFTIAQATQAITFTPSTPVTYGVSPITLVATGGASGNPIIFSIVSGGSYGSLSGTNNSVLTVTGPTGASAIVIAANQAGNGNYAAATAVQQSIVVNTAAQAITFTASSPVTYGVSPITLAATGGASSNPVVFTIVSGPGSISGNTLTVTGAGAIVIAANQAGNTNYAAATQVTASIVVNTATQAITFTPPTTPVAYGTSPITLTATGGASGLPVVFSIVSGPGSITGSTLSVTGAGAIVIAANQAGNTNYAAATQVTRSVVVNLATPTVATVSAVTSAYGSTTGITVTATESGSAGVVTGGAITFSVISPATGSFTLATCTLSAAGACTATYIPTGTLATGTYTNDIRASFAAVGNYTAVSGAATLTINPATPGITLATSVNPTLVQSAITFTAAVTSAIGTPTGTVSFMDGATQLGTGAIANGVAAFTTSTLAVGAHTITAVYTGDTNFITVTSSAQTETVLDFSLNISSVTGTGPVTSATVQPGGTAVFTVTISPVGSTTFPAAITLSASGLPPGATYVISPATLVAGSGTQTVTLTIQLPPSIAALHHGDGMNQFAPFALALLLLPFAGLMRKHAKRFGRMTWIVLLLIASVATMAGVTGCGGFFVQPPATYTVSLTGTSGNLSYSTPLTLTVE